MKGALIFRFSRPGVGREALGLEAFADAFTFFGKLAAEDRCEPPVLYMSPIAKNMMIVHGERETLAEIARTPEFRDVYLKAEFAAPDIIYEIAAVGDSAEQEMQTWAAKGVELALM